MATPPQETLQKKHDERSVIGLLSELQEQLNRCHEEQLNRCLEDMQKPGKAVSRSDKGHPSQGHSETEGGASRWSLVCAKILGVLRIKNAPTSKAHERSGSQRDSFKMQTRSDKLLTMHKLRSDIGQMKTAIEDLMACENYIGDELISDRRLHQLVEKVKTRDPKGPCQITDDLKEINKKIFNLRCKMPLMRHKQASRGLSNVSSQNAQWNDEIDDNGNDIYLPSLLMNDDFVNSSAFEEFKERFMGLKKIREKLCLLSFALFPENSELKKTMLMYWWIGEGFLPSGAEGEKSVAEILEEFSLRGLIEPVRDPRKLEPNSYKMEPQVHSSVILLAEKLGIFTIYDKKSESKKPIMIKSECKKVCLVEQSSSQQEAKVSKMQPGDLETVFNASERFPDFTFKWFPKMDSLKVLYLGRWERTPERHIEVESTELLENLKAMKKLRLVSLQGISRIERLNNSICKLPQLLILDLRACYSLEVLPEEIDMLKELRYLDVSECYMIDRMPKKIAGLRKLEVLKGFVVSDADDESCCTIPELIKLQKLRKLSINVNQAKFKMEELMKSLKELRRLESLKVAWGARFSEENNGGPPKEQKDKSPSEKQSRQEDNKERRSKEKKGDAEEIRTPQAEPEDKVQCKEEDGKGDIKAQTSQDRKGDGRNEEANPVKSEMSNEAGGAGTAQVEPVGKVRGKKEDSKRDNEAKTFKGKKGDGRKEEADLTVSKVHDGVEEKTQKSNEIVERDKKPSATTESKATIQKTPKLDESIEEEKKQSPTLESRGLLQKLKKQKIRIPGGSELPSSLKKLELECYPEEDPPSWLSPGNLGYLEKLSIKGGNLSRIIDKPSDTENKCKVKVLRLKYLDEFKAEWRDLHAMFPELILFEKYKCPKVTFCPSDGMGVWRP